MADLMKDTYKYSDLVNKYGNFYLPAVKIYVNGKDILGAQDWILESLEVVLSLTTASSAQFKLSNVYDVKNRSFTSGLTEKFKPGTIVEIGIGYYSSVIKILKGFVYMTGAEFGAKELFVVTVMDVRKLMMISGSRHVLHNVKNYSDAFKNVMKSYSRLCTTEVTATNDKLETPISQTGTDYEFVMEELVRKGKSSREFLVVGEKAYFRERPKNESPLMQVEYGRELLKLQMDYAYLDEEIQVIGYNTYEQTTYVGKAKAKSSESQSSLISPVPVRSISDPDADNQEKATRRAEFLAGQEMERVKTGRLTTLGMPELVPGRFLEVVKVEKMVNRKYYITEVRHRINDSFYTTEIETGGWR